MASSLLTWGEQPFETGKRSPNIRHLKLLVFCLSLLAVLNWSCTRLELERNLLLQPSDGHFFLRAFSVYDEKSNACFDAELDLQEERGYRIEGDTLSCF